MVVWCSVVMECEGGDVAVDGVASWGDGGEAVEVRVVVRRCDSGDGGVDELGDYYSISSLLDLGKEFRTLYALFIEYAVRGKAFIRKSQRLWGSSVVSWWRWQRDEDDEGGVMVAAVGRQPEEVEARGGEWIWGSGRSGLDLSLLYHFCGSPEKFSGGGWPEKVAAGRREGWPDIWRRREDL
ncbi:hypothetical protein Tco_1397964 [Tanacetum coccineum]